MRLRICDIWSSSAAKREAFSSTGGGGGLSPSLNLLTSCAGGSLVLRRSWVSRCFARGLWLPTGDGSSRGRGAKLGYGHRGGSRPDHCGPRGGSSVRPRDLLPFQLLNPHRVRSCPHPDGVTRHGGRIRSSNTPGRQASG
eukprot:6491784-Amphidinium_carterae.2